MKKRLVVEARQRLKDEKNKMREALKAAKDREYNEILTEKEREMTRQLAEMKERVLVAEKESAVAKAKEAEAYQKLEAKELEAGEKEAEAKESATEKENESQAESDEEQVEFNNSGGDDMELDEVELQGEREKTKSRVGEAIKIAFEMGIPIDGFDGKSFRAVASMLGMTDSDISLIESADPVFQTARFKAKKFMKLMKDKSSFVAKDEMMKREQIAKLAIELNRVGLEERLDFVADDETIQCDDEESLKYNEIIHLRDTIHQLFRTENPKVPMISKLRNSKTKSEHWWIFS